MPIINRFTGYGQGLGIFYEEESCKRFIESGMKIASDKTTFSDEQGECPVCHSGLVLTKHNGQP